MNVIKAIEIPNELVEDVIRLLASEFEIEAETINGSVLDNEQNIIRLQHDISLIRIVAKKDENDINSPLFWG